MGTHATTKVMDGDTVLLNLYRHFDGYLDGHGRELAQYLTSIDPMDSQELAADLVAHFKTGSKDFYIVPVDDVEEYDYVIRDDGDRVTVTCYGEQVFDGSPAQLLKASRSAAKTGGSMTQYSVTLDVNFTIESDAETIKGLKQDIEDGMVNTIEEGKTVEEVLTNDLIESLEDNWEGYGAYIGNAFTTDAEQIRGKKASLIQGHEYDINLAVSFTIEVDKDVLKEIKDDIAEGVADGESEEEVLVNDLIDLLESGGMEGSGHYFGNAWTVFADLLNGVANLEKIR